jgi:hypothetical protein
MTKHIARTLTGALALTMLAGCSKSLLNKTPSDQISLSDAFQKASDAQNWDAGFYASLRGNVYGNYMLNTDIQADQLNATLDYGNNYGSLQTWTINSDDYAISGEWSAYYAALANINKGLAGFPLIVPTDAADSATIQQCTGDAYLMRAFYYQELVLRWSKAYNSSSASTDLGVPLVLEYNTTALPSRATVQQVYTQILADLANARALLGNIPGSVGSNYFTVDAVLAQEARTKLYMEDWAGAEAVADSLIKGGTYALVTNTTDFGNMWAKDLPNESIVMLVATQPKEAPANMSPYLNFNTGTGALDPLYIPSQWVINMFDPADWRTAAYFTTAPTIIQGFPYTLTMVNKYPGNPTLWTGATSNYEQMPKVFRMGEIYLISAEAAANQGKSGPAIATLNALRAARGLSQLSSNISTDSLTNAIRDERFRELAFEGFRLDDLKRWNLGFTRTDPQNPNALVPGANFTTLSQVAGADKFVWGLPTNDITINANLVQNPGW